MIVAPIPALLTRLVDSATSDLDGRLTEVIDGHRRHQQAWYGGLMGLVVVRASALAELARGDAVQGLGVAVIADTGIDRLGVAIDALTDLGARVDRAEAAVAKRGEDPAPGVRQLLDVAQRLREGGRDVTVHAEIPLTGGLHDALDLLAEASTSLSVGATFRVGGLAGELFPPPPVLAGVICACRDREVPFSVGAGLDRALRHNDHETGFAHHGVLNVLTACLSAALGATPAAVADRLASNDPVLLAEVTHAARDQPRPLWTSYATARVEDVVHDLTIFDVVSTESDNPVS